MFVKNPRTRGPESPQARRLRAPPPFPSSSHGFFSVSLCLQTRCGQRNLPVRGQHPHPASQGGISPLPSHSGQRCWFGVCCLNLHSPCQTEAKKRGVNALFLWKQVPSPHTERCSGYHFPARNRELFIRSFWFSSVLCRHCKICHFHRMRCGIFLLFSTC